MHCKSSALSASVPRQEILSIIRLILNTLTVAMRFEPGNARLFESEVSFPRHNPFILY